MAITLGPMRVPVNDSMFVAPRFSSFPDLLLTRHAWLIGSYEGLRAFIKSMKSDETARSSFYAELQKCKLQLESLPGDNGLVLIRYGRRERDKIYDGKPEALAEIGDKKGSAQATRIGVKLSTDQTAEALKAGGIDHTHDRKTPVHSSYDRNQPGRVTDLSSEYKTHWGERQFEAHHIVEDSLDAMKDAKARFDGLTRGSSLCVLLSAELHQRFYTSALAQTRYTTPGGNLSERDNLNLNKAKLSFEQAYNQLYADPQFADIKTLATAIIGKAFSSA